MNLRTWFLILASVTVFPLPAEERGPEFVDLARVVPGVVIEMRYFGELNFVGRPVRGYEAPACLLTRPAAEALARVQGRLQPFGLGLKVFDCYRPQQAVDHFVAWAKDLDDTRHRHGFYPNVAKTELFDKGYIADKSSHSRGSTVDLTLIPLPATSRAAPPEQLPECTAPAESRPWEVSLDMGTAFDCFDPLSWTASGEVSAQARANRLLLKTVMESEGFVNYPKEWWHFTLADEPYPERRFDVPVAR